jgi:hypothetical protein
LRRRGSILFSNQSLLKELESNSQKVVGIFFRMLRPLPSEDFDRRELRLVELSAEWWAIMMTRGWSWSMKLPQRQRSQTKAPRVVPGENHNTAKFICFSGCPFLLSHPASSCHPGDRFQPANALHFYLLI